MDALDTRPSIQIETRKGTPSSPASPASPVSPTSPSRPTLNRSLTYQPHLFASMAGSIGIGSPVPRSNMTFEENMFRPQPPLLQQQQGQGHTVQQPIQQQQKLVLQPPQEQQSHQKLQQRLTGSNSSMHMEGNIANIESEPATTESALGLTPPNMTQTQTCPQQSIQHQRQSSPRPHSISDHSSSPHRSNQPTTALPGRSTVSALRPPYSTRANQAASTLASPSLAASAFAAHHKVYSMEDVGFWSTLYTQHFVHTRQSHETSQRYTSGNGNHSDADDKHTMDSHGPIKVWQALTKTSPKDPSQQPKFERLPIKVPTTAAASSSSLSGQPFTIVFFFTVESSPTTLWFLESAFTNSRTLNEYMELMGTFKPNVPNDPNSFYIYETQPLTLAAPTYEDTMLDIHVQSPTGTIYAAYSYTFVKTSPSPQMASPTTHASSPSSGSIPPPKMHSSPQHLSPAEVSGSKSKGAHKDNRSKTNTTVPSPNPFDGMNDDEVLDAIGHDVLEDDSSDEMEAETEVQEPAGETLPEEPDAGEHFMQATSEFFSKMGYWLYNSRVVQYIAREDRNRTKTVFPTDDIWILGVCYAFNESDNGHPMTAPPRSKKGSIFTSLEIGSKTRRASSLLSSTSHPVNPRSPPSSMLSFSTGSEESGSSKQDMGTKLHNKPSGSLAVPIIHEGLLAAQGRNDDKARSRSHERKYEKEVLKEQARVRKEAKAKEKDQQKERKAVAKAMEREAHEREKELHKEQKLERLRQRQREKELEKERKQQRKHEKEVQRTSAPQYHNQLYVQHPPMESTPSRTIPSAPSSPLFASSPQSSPEFRRRPKHLNLHHSSHHPVDNHSDQIGKQDYLDPDRRDDERGSASVVRRMRSMSILPKVASSIDLLAFRKSPEPSATGFTPERTHQPRSKSISNLASFIPRSATSSTASSPSENTSRPNSPYSPNQSMSFHEALAMGPKTSMLSRLSQLNLSTKKLPALPQTVDDIPDLPIYPPLTMDRRDSMPTTPTSPVQPVVIGTTSPESPRRPNRRRMTISGIFSRESSNEASSGFNNIKTLFGSSNINRKSKTSLVPEREQQPPPPSPGLARGSGVEATGKYAHKSTTPSLSSSSSSSGHSKRDSIFKWAEKRNATGDYRETVFIASTEEPVPALSKDAASSLAVHVPHIRSSPLPRLHSPLELPSVAADSHTTHNSWNNATPPSSPLTSRRRKKSSILSSLTPGSSPKSVLKNARSSPLLNAPPFAGSTLAGPTTPTKVSSVDIGPLLLSPKDGSALVSPTPRSTKVHSTLYSMSSQQLHPDNALGILTSQNVGQMRSSPANKMDHSSLHPESPTETFVLLDSGSHPVYGRTPRMGHDSMIHMEDSRLSLELLYNDARQDTPSPSTEVEPSVQRPASRQHRAMSPSQKSSTTNALRIHMDVDTTDLRSDWEALWSSDRNQQEPQPLESSYMTEFVHVQESECKSLRTKSENSLKKQQILSESHMEDNDKEVLVEKDDLNDQADESILEEGDDETILVTPQRLTLGRAEPHLISVKRDDETGQIPSNFTTTSSKSTMRSSTTLAASSPSPSLTRSFSFLSQQTIPRPASTTSATSVTAAVSGRSNLLSQETTASTLTEEPDELDASFIEEPSSEEKRSNHHHHFSHGRHQQSKNLHPKADMTFIPPSSAAYLSQFKPAPPDQLTPNQVVLYNSMLDFQSKIWFTYRKDIPRIEPSFYTSDAGWGCMMRTGQSLLAQGFLQALLGRPWRATTAQSESTKSVYKMILSWFVDEPERPYSIQNIAKCGLVLDKRIGEWFGPATVAHALLRLSQKHTNCPLALIVPMDGVIRTSEVMQAALSSTTPLQPSSVSSTGHNRQQASASTQDLSSSASSTTAGWKPVVVLMPVRFGLQKLKEQYGANLKRLFQLPQFLGIAGGRPGRSLYFLGNQGNELFYLDPHIVKPRVSTDEMNTFPVTSFHCTVVRSMEIHEMDPSMLLGFVITSKEDLDDLYTRYNELIDRKYDLVSFVRDAPSSSSSSSSDKTHAHSGPQSSSVSGGGTSTQGEKDVSSHTLSSPSPQPVGVYEYRYTSHVGDHAYDPETFSVHSLDSDEE